MPGYGGASSSGGSRGAGGSAGAFTGGGLTTGANWYGTKAHFGAGGLQGYSTKGGDFRSPTGQSVNSNFQSGQGKGNWPGGYATPVLSQPIPPRPAPPPPNVVPAVAPPPTVIGPWENVPPPTNWYDALRSSVPPGTGFGAFGTGYSKYNDLRSSFPPGNGFTGFGNQAGYGTNMAKNNMGAPAMNGQSHHTSSIGGGWRGAGR